MVSLASQHHNGIKNSTIGLSNSVIKYNLKTFGQLSDFDIKKCLLLSLSPLIKSIKRIFKKKMTQLCSGNGERPSAQCMVILVS
jgi:hypothetical protein